MLKSLDCHTASAQAGDLCKHPAEEPCVSEGTRWTLLHRGARQAAKGKQKSLAPGQPLSSPSAQLCSFCTSSWLLQSQDQVSELIWVGTEGFMAWEVKDSWR